MRVLFCPFVLFVFSVHAQTATVTFYVPQDSQAAAKVLAETAASSKVVPEIVSVYVDGHKLTSLKAGRFVSLLLPVKRYTLLGAGRQRRFTGIKTWTSLSIRINPGESYFFRMSVMHTGRSSAQTVTYEIKEQNCAEAQEETQRIDPQSMNDVGRRFRQYILTTASLPGCSK